MIIDTNHDTTSHLPSLKAKGVVSIIRYFNRLNPKGEKTIKPPELAAIRDAGMTAGIVYEGKGNQLSAFTGDMGTADGTWAFDYANRLKIPENSAIYFAVDYDFSVNQIRNVIIPYFQEVNDALAGQNDSESPTQKASYRIGVYGSGLVLQMIEDAGLAELFWLSCSSGWTGTKEFLANGDWNLNQHLPPRNGGALGLDHDPNDANPALADYGAFTPV